LKHLKSICLVLAFMALSATANAQTMHNERFKLNALPNTPFKDFVRTRGLSVSGVWQPESKVKGKELVFPLQVHISCSTRSPQNGYRQTENGGTCHVYTAAFGMTPLAVSVQDIDEDDFEISSRSDTGLVATDEDLCQTHTLSVSFTSGAVSLADVPNHKEGCEQLKEINTYRLIRGEYYVDTTPKNDLDKQGGPK
jgi:hypothetical protein